MTTKITASPQFKPVRPRLAAGRYPPPGWPRFAPRVSAAAAPTSNGAIAPLEVPRRRFPVEPVIAPSEADVPQAPQALRSPREAPHAVPAAEAHAALEASVAAIVDEPPPPTVETKVDAARASGSERLLFAAVAFAGLLVPLNSTMIAVALPDIRSAFDVSRGAIAWLLSSYLITVTVAQPIAGSLGDQLGRARVLRVALLLFLICSLAATVAPTFELLVISRVGQAISGATFIPTGMAMLRAIVPVTRFGRRVGLFEAVMGTAAAVGPLIGALLIEGGSWRLLFVVNVPMVAIALWLVLRLNYRDTETAARPRLDWIGAGFLVGILSGITWLFGAFDAGESEIAIGVVSAAVVVLALGFVGRQVSSRVTLAPWGLFRIPSFSAAILYALMTNIVFYAALLTIPFFIREVQNGSAARIGLLLGALSVQYAVMAPLGGRLSDRVGRRVPALLGALLSFAGVTMAAVGLSVDVSFAYLAVALALVGSGLGLGATPATTAAVEIAPRAQAGAVNGTDQMVTYVGSIIGAGVLAAVLGGPGAAPEIGLFRTVFIVASVIAGLTVVAALVIHTRVRELPPSRPDLVASPRQRRERPQSVELA